MNKVYRRYAKCLCRDLQRKLASEELLERTPVQILRCVVDSFDDAGVIPTRWKVLRVLECSLQDRLGFKLLARDLEVTDGPESR